MDFGIIVDGAVIVIENIMHRLSQRGEGMNEKERKTLITEAANEVGRPTLFSMLIIIAALVPVFTLEQVEGRIFRPLALTYSFALAAAFAPEGRLTRLCHFSYELRLHRARGYGALKAILDILAEDEGLTLTEISHRLERTPGSTKDYLSWLEDVDLVVARGKRYSYADPLLRVWVRLHGRAAASSEEDLGREVHRFALPRLPHTPEPALAMAAAGGGESLSDADRKDWGIIEID